jgi:hypothetical protein
VIAAQRGFHPLTAMAASPASWTIYMKLFNKWRLNPAARTLQRDFVEGECALWPPAFHNSEAIPRALRSFRFWRRLHS